jgi:hypothetical protein
MAPIIAPLFVISIALLGLGFIIGEGFILALALVLVGAALMTVLVRRSRPDDVGTKFRLP